MKRTILFVFACLIILASCRKEKKLSGFSNNILAPLLKTDLGFDDLAKDMVLADPSGQWSFVYDYELYRGNITEIFNIPDTNQVATATLEQLALAAPSYNQKVPLYALYPAAMSQHGTTNTIPEQVVTNLSEVSIDVSDYFQSANMQSGWLDITIDNGYPVEVLELIFELRNASDMSLIAVDTFRNILPKTKQTKSLDLSGKTLYGSMKAKSTLVHTAASPGPVYINALDEAVISIVGRELKPYTALAKFPNQSVYQRDEVVVYDFGGAQVKKMILKSGILRIELESSIHENTTVNYLIPYATKGGVPFEQKIQVPAAPPSGKTIIQKDFDLSGYDVDLRGKNPIVDDTVNSFYSALNITVDSSGNTVQLSLNDSFHLYYGLLDLKPEYAEGYFGQQNVDIGPATIDFDLFSQLGGKLDFETMNFSLDISNGVGADAQATFLYLTSRNPKGGLSSLNSSLIASPVSLDPATYPPLTPSLKRLQFTEGNSNIKNFIEIFPNKLDYHVKFQTNPNGNVRMFKDFITDKSEVIATLNANFPVSIKAEGLTMSDTIDFNLSSVERSDKVLEATFYLIVNNGFPFEVETQLYLLDGNGKIMDSLMTAPLNKVLPGQIDQATNKVTAPRESVIAAKVGPDKINTMRAAKSIIVKAKLDTPKTNTNYYKLYSSYKLGVTLTGDFLYAQNL